MLIEELDSKKLYKIVHKDITIGKKYSDFTALTNCIIFLPCGEIEEGHKCWHIYTKFLITFDLCVLLNGTTSMFSKTDLKPLNDKDFETIINVFKSSNNMDRLNAFLKDTSYRYNRKLNKIIEIH